MYVNIIIPAYKRFESLQRTLLSIKESDYKKIFTTIIVDGFQDDRYAQLKDNQTAVIYNPKREDWLRCINKALRCIDGELFLYGADDIKFYPNCISKLVETMKSTFPSGDGIVGLRQHQKKSSGAFGLIGNKFIERFPDRTVFCPDYMHFNSDTELRDFAVKAGLYYYRTDALVWHDRSFRVAHDESYSLGARGKFKDKGTYNMRRKRCFLWGKNFYRLYEESAILEEIQWDLL